MAQRVFEKTVALALTALILLLSILTALGVIKASMFGVSTLSPFANRFLYPFFHASLLHAIVNVWVWLSVIFVYTPSWGVLLLAYIIAVIVPTCFLAATPTVGLSVVIYALFGYITPFVKRKAYFVMWIAIYIAIGFCFGSVNAWIHLYAYLAGLTIGFLNAPLLCVKR